MSPEELRERLGRACLTPYRLSYLLGVEPNEGSKWTRGDRPVPKGRVAQIIELTDFVAAHCYPLDDRRRVERIADGSPPHGAESCRGSRPASNAALFNIFALAR
jgi:hypothetical protein